MGWHTSVARRTATLVSTNPVQAFQCVGLDISIEVVIHHLAIGKHCLAAIRITDGDSTSIRAWDLPKNHDSTVCLL